MSESKNFMEAQRWLITAEDDLDTAKILYEKGKYAHACFHTQQAGEKALKALWFFLDLEPWGHSVRLLIDELKEKSRPVYLRLSKEASRAAVLDRYYIPTRYPDGLPDIRPDQAFMDDDAVLGMKLAAELVRFVNKEMDS
jgi:HEPN domain-containing protein